MNDIEVFGTKLKEALENRGNRPMMIKGEELEEDYAVEHDNVKIPKNELRMWAVHQGNTYTACEEAVSTLKPGQYVVGHSNHLGYYFKKVPVTLDSLVELCDSSADEILKEIETFWSKKDVYQEHGFLWKRGIMLYGPPGSGKTSLLQMVSNRIIEKEGIAVYVSNPHTATIALKQFRQIQPDTPVVLMLEDIDAIIKEYGESALLALLDGELQIDNVLSIATTNYPELLDPRIVNRPSRFDIVRKIGMPNADARRQYISSKHRKIKNNPDEMDKWVKLTDGFSIAHIKELIISVEVFDVTVDNAVKRIKTMMSCKPSSDSNSVGIGFE